jgi:uncharacterized protein YkwD
VNVRRLLSVACIASGVAIAAAVSATWAREPLGTLHQVAAKEASFATAINRARAARGISPVTVDEQLIVAARTHTRAMLSGGYFAHRNWSGELARVGITGFVGQILGWHAVVHGSVQLLLRMWLASPEHRTILLDPRYHRVGVGVAVGEFEGFPRALVVTADFSSE